ncbi:MAG: hypothetical protein PHX54_08160 [Lentimicrobiaceae bacterium]|nr:hypothetical protein [Lentimicrobiaceae bacterium]
MLFNIKKAIISHLQNLPGWRTRKKIVVIESDDWGSIRMPSREVYNKLLSEGYNVDRDPFMKFDNLATPSDLFRLFEVLNAVKDSRGRPAVMTANTIVANPDFEKIREAEFRSYFYEPFTATLKRYPEHGESFKMWKQGMDAGVFHPQFHGREHLNVNRWLLGLRQNDSMLRHAFEHNMISISSQPNDMRFDYMEALDYYSPSEKESKPQVIEEGLKLFNDIFGYGSTSFIACCYVWDNEIEKTLHHHGVKYIQGVVQQLIPNMHGERHSYKKSIHYTGQRNTLNQLYLARNAYFEPALLGPDTDHIGYCMQRMGAAFRMNKPAIIASHRLNYIGSIHTENRDNNLQMLSELLKTITTRWPDVEFMTSDELGRYIQTNEVSYRT